MFSKIITILYVLARLAQWVMDRIAYNRGHQAGAGETIEKVKENQSAAAEEARAIHERVDTDPEYRERLRAAIERARAEPGSKS